MEFIVIAVILFVGNIILNKLKLISEKLDKLENMIAVKNTYSSVNDIDLPFSEPEHYRRDDIDFTQYIGGEDNE